MMRILLFIFLSLAFAFFLQQSQIEMGEVVIRWYGYQVNMPATFLCAGLIFACILFFFGGQFWAFLMRAPKSLQQWRDKKRYEQGFETFLEGMEALSLGDAKQASKLAAKTQKLLPDSRLVNLISGQSAAMAGEDVKAIAYYGDLAAQEGGQFLGLKGLIEEYKKQKNWAKVKEFAAQAYAMKPKSGFVVQSLFESLLYTKDFDEALKLMPAAQKYGDYTSEKIDEIEAFIYLDQAENMEGKEQIKLLEKSIKACAHNVPAFLKLASVYSEGGDTAQTLKFINKSFKDTPNPALYEAWVSYMEKEPEKLYKRRFSAFIKSHDSDVSGLYIQALEYLRLGDKLKAFDAVQKAREIEDCRQLKGLWLRTTNLLGQSNFDMQKALEKLTSLPVYHFAGDDILKAYQEWKSQSVQETEALPAPSKRAFGLLAAKKV